MARASAEGVRSFEHYDDYFDTSAGVVAVSDQVTLAGAFARDKTAIVPTLIAREWRRRSLNEAMAMLDDPRQRAPMRSAGISARTVEVWRRKVSLAQLEPPLDWVPAWNAGVSFVRLAYRNGVSVLPGTDLGVPFIYPGRSLLDELESFVDDLHLTPREAIAAATVAPARWFGLEDSIGSVASGKLADIVLLGSDPLARIGNLHDVIGVMIRGRYYDRLALPRLTLTLASE